MSDTVRLPSIQSLLNNDEPVSPPTARRPVARIGSRPASSEAMTKATNPNKRRSNLPKETIQVLNQWLLDHLQNPYPTQQEKRELLIKTGLTKIQLSNWFINVRRRKIFNDYYTLASNLPESSALTQAQAQAQTQTPTPSTDSVTNTSHTGEEGTAPPGAPPVTIMSDNEFSKRFVQAPLTRRKKLIDRLEELKKLTNNHDNNH